jgi:hypothetical protein
VADRYFDALVAQPGDIGALGGVRALHGIAKIAQHLGDAAHADAADPDEVDGSNLARQSHGFPGAVITGEKPAIQSSAALSHRPRKLLDAPLSKALTRPFCVIPGHETALTSSAHGGAALRFRLAAGLKIRMGHPED